MKDSTFRNIMHIALGSSCKSSNLYASFRDNSVQEITTRNSFGIGRNTHKHARKYGIKQVGPNFSNILSMKVCPIFSVKVARDMLIHITL